MGREKVYMITDKLQILLICAMFIYFIFLYQLLKKNHIIMKYALLWIFGGIVLLLLVFFPNLIKVASRIVGIYSDVNLLFLVMIGCLYIITLSLTVILSRLSYDNRKLTQQLALLEKEVSDNIYRG